MHMKRKVVSVQNAKAMERLRHTIRLLWKGLERANSEQPGWQAAVVSLGLPKENADELVRALNHLRLLPFGEIKAISPRC